MQTHDDEQVMQTVPLASDEASSPLTIRDIVALSDTLAHEQTLRIRQSMERLLTRDYLLGHVVQARERGRSCFSLSLCDDDDKEPFNRLVDYHAVFQDSVKPTIHRHLTKEEFEAIGDYVTDVCGVLVGYKITVKWTQVSNLSFSSLFCGFRW